MTADHSPTTSSSELKGSEQPAFDPYSIRRPDPALLTHFILTSLFALIFFQIVFLPLYFKYRTLEYVFDESGIAMRWGLLFRREINLTYRRIQDIHVVRGLIQRWLGLSSLSIQTASGTSGAEMTIIGIRNPEALRDFLYSKMRGANESDDDRRVDHATSAESSTIDDRPERQLSSSSVIDPADEALLLLREIRDELRSISDGSGQPMNEHAETSSPHDLESSS